MPDEQRNLTDPLLDENPGNSQERPSLRKRILIWLGPVLSVDYNYGWEDKFLYIDFRLPRIGFKEFVGPSYTAEYLANETVSIRHYAHNYDNDIRITEAIGLWFLPKFVINFLLFAYQFTGLLAFQLVAVPIHYIFLCPVYWCINKWRGADAKKLSYSLPGSSKPPSTINGDEDKDEYPAPATVTMVNIVLLIPKIFLLVAKGMQRFVTYYFHQFFRKANILTTITRNLLETKEEKKYRESAEVLQKYISSFVLWQLSAIELYPEKNFHKLLPEHLVTAKDTPRYYYSQISSIAEPLYTGNPEQKALLEAIAHSSAPEVVKTALTGICKLKGLIETPLDENARRDLLAQTLNSILGCCKNNDPNFTRKRYYLNALTGIVRQEPNRIYTGDELRAYATGNARPVYHALLDIAERRDLTREELRLFDSILSGLTTEQRRQALTPHNPRENAENPLVILAQDHNRGEMIDILRRCGLIEGFQAARGRIANNQDVHNIAVHKTVTDSLNALKNSNKWLTSQQCETSLQSLKLFADSLMSDDASNEFDPVSRRALNSLLNPSFKNVSDSGSEVTVHQILAHFWHYHEQQSDRDKLTSLGAFKAALFTCQRGYSTSDTSFDRPICGGGTVNQLTIALGSVLPELVWIEFMDENRLTLCALNWIAANLEQSYKDAPAAIRSEARKQISGLLNTPYKEPLPDALWPLLESDLKKALNGFLLNNKFKPPRSCVENPKQMLTSVITQLKAGAFNRTIEMNASCNTINKITEGLNKKVEHENPQRVKDIHHLDNPRDTDDESEPTARPVLAQYHLEIKTSPQPLAYEATVAYNLIKAKQKCTRTFTQEQLNELPDDFKKLADNPEFVQAISALLNRSRDGKIYLLDTLNETLVNPMSIEKLQEVMQILDKDIIIDSNLELEDALHDNSQALCSAWMALCKFPIEQFKAAAKLL